MKYTRIPAGYKIEVTTWENDGDDYHTTHIAGLGLDEVRLLVKLAELVYSHNRLGERSYGNIYEPTEEQCDDLDRAIQTTFDKYNTQSITWSVDRCCDKLVDLHLMGCSEFHTRVLSKIVVEHYPVALHIEDVTEQFVTNVS